MKKKKINCVTHFAIWSTDNDVTFFVSCFYLSEFVNSKLNEIVESNLLFE